jgi:hypothetical protein
MPSYQPERVAVTINGAPVYLRGAVEYDVNTGARLGTLIRDVLTYSDVVARSGLCLPVPTVTYSDVHGSKNIPVGGSVAPLPGSVFVVR